MFVKRTEEEKVWFPCLPLSSSFLNILWNPGQWVSLPPCQSCTQRLYGCSCCRIRSTFLGMAVKVLKHSFLMSPNESFAECGCAAPLWPRLENASPSPLSPILKHTSAHLSLILLPSIQAVTHPFISACADFSSSHVFIHLKSGAITDGQSELLLTLLFMSGTKVTV